MVGDVNINSRLADLPLCPLLAGYTPTPVRYAPLIVRDPEPPVRPIAGRKRGRRAKSESV